jgi:hypothetical protein
MSRYEVGGLEALSDGSQRPKSVPHQMAAKIETTVLEMRRHHPGWGPVRLRYELERADIVAPSHMAIYRALLRHGLIQPGAKRKKLPTYKRWERGRPTALNSKYSPASMTTRASASDSDWELWRASTIPSPNQVRRLSPPQWIGQHMVQ